MIDEKLSTLIRAVSEGKFSELKEYNALAEWLIKECAPEVGALDYHELFTSTVISQLDFQAIISTALAIEPLSLQNAINLLTCFKTAYEKQNGSKVSEAIDSLLDKLRSFSDLVVLLSQQDEQIKDTIPPNWRSVKFLDFLDDSFFHRIFKIDSHIANLLLDVATQCSRPRPFMNLNQFINVFEISNSSSSPTLWDNDESTLNSNSNFSDSKDASFEEVDISMAVSSFLHI